MLCKNFQYLYDLSDEKLALREAVFLGRIKEVESQNEPAILKEFWTEKLEAVRRISAERKEAVAL
jgi:hypothetical protein